MTDSLILRAATRLLVALMLVFSLYILFRGHNQPGGGFIGALIASTAFIVYTMAQGPGAVRRALVVDPRILCVAGLGASLVAGLLAVIAGAPFLTGVWDPAYAEGRSPLPISTVLVFDIGVYLVVLGAVLTLVLALEEEG